MQVGSPLKGHTDSITSVVFSPDGKRIISDSDCKTLKVLESIHHLELARGHEVTQLGCVHQSVSGNHNGKHHDCNSLVHELSYKGHGLARPVKFHDDGWIRGHNNALLLWIPPALQKPFYSNYNIMVIPRDACVELDLSKMSHGIEWQNCFKVNNICL
ncbi:hypothetical protein ID866_10154 [Astraeus odoratus]|nr:hypothetical protein ID866_10154 [Astraeus odoratus]